MTPDVRTDLHRAAANVFATAAAFLHVVERALLVAGYLTDAGQVWLEQRSEICEARAETNDPESIADLVEQEEDD